MLMLVSNWCVRKYCFRNKSFIQRTLERETERFSQFKYKSGMRLILETSNFVRKQSSNFPGISHNEHLNLSFFHTNLYVCVVCVCRCRFNRYQQLDLDETWTEYGRLLYRITFWRDADGGIIVMCSYVYMNSIVRIYSESYDFVRVAFNHYERKRQLSRKFPVFFRVQE